MGYQFSHYTVNGLVVPERETAIVMNNDVELIAHYREEGPMSVKIKNEEAQDQIIVKTTIIAETITIAPGETKEIPFNPATDILILKPNP